VWTHINARNDHCDHNDRDKDNARKDHVQIGHEESLYSSTGGHPNYDFCNILSTPDLHDRKSPELLSYNKPTHDRSNVNDTNDLSRGATTNHSRKIGLYEDREQRKHLVY
jgi:hypothetical protein